MSLVNLYRYEDALVSLNTANQLDPSLEDVHFYKGEAYVKMGQIPSAIKEYSIEIKMNAKSVNSHAGRAVCFILLKHYKEAVSNLDIALSL